MEPIKDMDIPTATPEDLLRTYDKWIYKFCNRYKEYLINNIPSIDVEDLAQSARLAVLAAQKTYIPENYSFLTWSRYYIKNAIRQTIRPGRSGDIPPELTVSLDEPVPWLDDVTLKEQIPDEMTPTPEQIMDESAGREEIAEEVHAAIGRLKNRRFQEAIQRIWIDGQDKATAAAEMGIKESALRNYDLSGRYKLRRDKRLQELAYPLFRVGVNTFNTTMTSAVEQAILWRERRFDQVYGVGTYAAHDTTQNGQDDEQKYP